ncbi:MAG: hypothetical protein IJB86_11295 [Clostridia bacterium]|nr:hypothetical protein [Clostridia bacterium]
MKSLGILRLGERRRHELSDSEVNYLLRHPYKWILLYEEPFFEKIDPFVLKLYDFLGKVYEYFK